MQINPYEYLDSLKEKGWNLELETIKKFMNYLENPQNNLNAIHIAGTNGKGSVVSMISHILNEAGYKTGSFTSPHLLDVKERIRINNKEIPEKDFAELVYELKRKSEESNISPSYFEFLTALAFSHFEREKVDFAVIETGLGGRLDATNVIEKSREKARIEIITNIQEDHKKYLGNSLEEIAREKIEIIKEGSVVITGEEKKEILNLIESKAREKKSYFNAVNTNNFTLKEMTKSKTLFLHSGKEYELRLPGMHQIKNAVIALACISELKKLGFKIPDEAACNGLKETKWAGRFELIEANKNQFNKEFILDACHNPAGIKSFTGSFQKLYGNEKTVIIFGASKDKEVRRMISLLLPITDEFIAINSSNKRAMESSKLYKLAEKRFAGKIEISNSENMKKAIELAVKNSKKHLPVCILGSIYLIGDAKKHLLLSK